MAFVSGSIVFLLLSAVGTYNAFNFTESVQFCGETCHKVMKPELTTHDHGPHARVACVECHVGKGVSWFVKSKISGSYQLYAVAFHKYPTPDPARRSKICVPSRDTCEECHWPQSFVGNLDRTFNYFQSDASNSPYSIRLLLKVGGSDPDDAGRSAASTGTTCPATRWNTSPPTMARQKIPVGARDGRAGQRHRVQDQKFHERRCPRWKSARWTAWTATTVRRTAISRRNAR